MDGSLNPLSAAAVSTVTQHADAPQRSRCRGAGTRLSRRLGPMEARRSCKAGRRPAESEQRPGEHLARL